MNSDILWSNTSQKQESLLSIEADRPIAISVKNRTNDAVPIRTIDISFPNKTDNGF
jgi:hypothetical protein